MSPQILAYQRASYRPGCTTDNRQLKKHEKFFEKRPCVHTIYSFRIQRFCQLACL